MTAVQTLQYTTVGFYYFSPILSYSVSFYHQECKQGTKKWILAWPRSTLASKVVAFKAATSGIVAVSGGFF